MVARLTPFPRRPTGRGRRVARGGGRGDQRAGAGAGATRCAVVGPLPAAVGAGALPPAVVGALPPAAGPGAGRAPWPPPGGGIGRGASRARVSVRGSPPADCTVTFTEVPGLPIKR